MKRLLIIIAGLFSIAYGQRYQTMPAEGYGPIKRMRVDSVLNIPIGDTTRKRNLSDGKDSGQIRWFNGSLYVYNGAYWSGVSGGGSGITHTELQDTADAIRASIENYGTFLGDRTINGAGYNFTIDSTFTTEIKSRVNDGGTDVAGLYLDAGNDVGTILYYNTDSTVSQSYHDYSSSGFNFNKISGVNQRNSGINIGINPITQKHLASISADSFQVDIPSAVAGYVLTATDIHGTATWQPASSGGSNVGDSLVRAFDSLAAHNTRIGANTVALSGKLNISDSALIQRQSFIFPTRRGYSLYPQIAGTRPLEFINLGNTAGSSATAQQMPSALVKNNWSQIGIQNMIWDSTNTRWLQSVNLGSQSGASAYEAGYEGVTLHAVSGTNFPLFNGTWHEGLQVRHSGVDGVAGLTSGQFVQAKFPIFIAYKSGTYTDDTHPWAGGSSRQDTAMIWLQSNEVKGTTGEYFRIEQNTSTVTGGQFYFRKSRGSYASKTVSSSGDNAGVLAYSQWDGSAYQSTARVLSYMDSAANTNRVPQSLAFQTSQNTTANVTTRMRIWNTGAVVIGGGNTAPSTGSIVDIQSTTGALVIPRMTTTQRNALTPVAGAMVYCTDCTATDGSTGVSQTYNGSAWKNHY